MENDRPLTLSIRGVSMAPLLLEGDRVTFVTSPTLSKGDVVLLRDKGHKEFIVHRYLGNGLFKGDNNPYFDSHELEVLGVLTSLNGRPFHVLKLANMIKAKLSGNYLHHRPKPLRIIWKLPLWILNWLTRRYCILAHQK